MKPCSLSHPVVSIVLKVCRTTVLAAVSTYASSASAFALEVWYVTENGQLGHGGHSFSDSLPLDYALTTASHAGDVVVVAEGSYPVPITNGAPGSFVVAEHRQLLGGYAGTEFAPPGFVPQRSSQSLFVNTVLEGDLGTTLGKSQHVVVIPFTDAGQVVVDGFLIQGGYSTGGKGSWTPVLRSSCDTAQL